MSMVGFPLLLIPIAIYNIIAFLMPGVSFSDTLVKTRLISGAEWTVTFGDSLVALGVLMLLLEVIKSARPGTKYLTDHLLSLIVFGAAAAEFLMWSKFGSSTYFLLTLLALTDFLSGVALHARRGAKATVQRPVPARATPPIAAEPIDGPAPEPAAIALPQTADAHAVPEAHPVAEVRSPSEPQSWPDPQAAGDPQPAAEVASAASIAESVLMDHPEPKPAREPKIA
jgi:hypothetical protein